MLAEFLGVSRPTISAWIARGNLDENLILQKIPEIRMQFLRTGKLPMTEQRDIIDTLLKRIEFLERRLDELEKIKREV